MKAIGYIRTSTDHQELSPEAQAEKIRHFAALHDCELVEVVVDAATSGRSKFEDRELGRRALELLAEADVIIFAKLSRAFRNAADALTLVPKLLKSGKDVMFLDLGMSVRTPNGKMFMGMLAVQAEWEADIISERITEALAAAKRQGKKIGPAPFGFKNRARIVDGRKVDGGLHEAVDGEAETLLLIRAWRREGFSFREIATLLTGRGIPTQRGGKWAPETCRKILRRMAS